MTTSYPIPGPRLKNVIVPVFSLKILIVKLRIKSSKETRMHHNSVQAFKVLFVTHLNLVLKIMVVVTYNE